VKGHSEMKKLVEALRREVSTDVDAKPTQYDQAAA
jgi:hypothetical protein